MPEMFGKNKFIRFAKIPIPPVITMLGKMPNHKTKLFNSTTPEPEETTQTPLNESGSAMDPDSDSYGKNAAGSDGHEGCDDIMAKLQAKFVKYEKEDQQAGIVRSFIHPGGRPDEDRYAPMGATWREGMEDMEGMDDFEMAHQTAGACLGFGFRKGDTFYINETLRCGDRPKQSRATVLVYLALHYCDIDSNGFCPFGNTREIAKLTSLTVRTVRNSLWKLAESGYIQIGSILRDGNFTFYEPDYKNIGLTYIEGGRGYLNLEDGMLRQLASMRDVNSLRAALRMLITVDNPRSSGEAVVNGRNMRMSMPGYVTKSIFQAAVTKIREACSFLDIGGNLESDIFKVSLPKQEDAKVRKAESDMENLEDLEKYIPQLSSLYRKEYDEAERFHSRCGKYPPYINALEYEKNHLDRELIFKAERDEAMQYASMATQYGIGIVKQGLKFIANEVSIFRKWIDCKPAYLRQMIRRHPDGVFNHM